MWSKFQEWIKKNQLLVFFLIAFLYTWSFMILAVLLIPDKVREPYVYIPSIYGPTIAAILIPLIIGGFKGMVDFIRQRLAWKVNLIWYLIALFGIPVLLLSLRGIHLVLFPEISLEPLEINRTALQVLSGFLLMLPFGPLAEELGWRGFAIPRMQKGMNALVASLVMGLIWWAWHLPQLLIPELQWAVGGIPPLIYLLMIMPGAVLASWIFNNARQSALLPILFHCSMNYFMGLLGFNSPYAFALIMAGLWGAAGLAVLISGSDLQLSKGGSRKLILDRAISQ